MFQFFGLVGCIVWNVWDQYQFGFFDIYFDDGGVDQVIFLEQVYVGQLCGDVWQVVDVGVQGVEVQYVQSQKGLQIYGDFFFGMGYEKVL